MWFLDKEFLEKLDLSAYDADLIAKNTGVDLDKVKAFVSPDRRYIVQSNHHYSFLAGANQDHRPCLLFVGGPRFGDQPKHNLNFVSFDTNWEPQYAGCIIADDANWDDILDAAEAEVGFIHVGNCPAVAFKHPEIWSCALVPFPFHLHQEALEGAEDMDTVKNWIETEEYVLHWGNAYFIDKEGEVTSS